MPAHELAEVSGGLAVRAAEAGDLPSIADLFAAAVDELAGIRGGGQFVADLSDRAGVNLHVHAGRFKLLSESLATGAPGLWVGECDGRVAGFGWGRVDQHSEFGPRLGVIDVLYVGRDARSRGLGEQLVAAIQAFFESQGCSSMDAFALPGDREGKNLYEETGLKARLLVMTRSIGTSPRRSPD